MLRIKLTCLNHRRYDPDKDGEGGIRGACKMCSAMFQLWLQAQQLQRLGYEMSHTETEEDIA